MNDESLKQLLREVMQEEMKPLIKRLDNQESVLEKQFKTLEQHGKLLEKQGKLLDQQGKQIESLGKRMDALEKAVADQGKQLKKLQNTVDGHGKMLEKHDSMLNSHGEMLTQLIGMVAALGKEHGELRVKQDATEEAVRELNEAQSQIRTEGDLKMRKLDRRVTLAEMQMDETLAAMNKLA